MAPRQVETFSTATGIPAGDSPILYTSYTDRGSDISYDSSAAHTQSQPSWWNKIRSKTGNNGVRKRKISAKLCVCGWFTSRRVDTWTIREAIAAPPSITNLSALRRRGRARTNCWSCFRLPVCTSAVRTTRNRQSTTVPGLAISRRKSGGGCLGIRSASSNVGGVARPRSPRLIRPRIRA